MSRIHEALERAEQDRKSVRSSSGAVNGMGAPFTPTEERGTWGAAAPDIDQLEQCPCSEWRSASKHTIIEERRENQPVAEEFRTLRSRLQQMQTQRSLKKVLISSAFQGEGKSFVASNLAIVLAKQRNRRVLLVDGDLRRSQLHTILGAPSTPGLSEYLRGRADQWAVIQRAPQLKNLYFIPGGESTDPGAELITNGSLASLINRCEALFDWIIVDSSPMIPVADAASMAQFCDGVLLVVRADSTPADMARKVRSHIRDEQWLGAVLNRVSPAGGRFSYYYSGAAHKNE
jgi:protein-tyrosine kinase